MLLGVGHLIFLFRFSLCCKRYWGKSMLKLVQIYWVDTFPLGIYQRWLTIFVEHFHLSRFHFRSFNSFSNFEDLRFPNLIHFPKFESLTPTIRINQLVSSEFAGLLTIKLQLSSWCFNIINGEDRNSKGWLRWFGSSHDLTQDPWKWHDI